MTVVSMFVYGIYDEVLFNNIMFYVFVMFAKL